MSFRVSGELGRGVSGRWFSPFPAPLGSELIVVLDEKLKYFRNKILPLETKGVRKRCFLSSNVGKPLSTSIYVIWCGIKLRKTLIVNGQTEVVPSLPSVPSHLHICLPLPRVSSVTLLRMEMGSPAEDGCGLTLK